MKRLSSSIAALAVAALALASAVATQAVATVSHAAQRAVYVGTYRAQCFACGMRDALGAALFSLQVRTGAILQAFPGTVSAGLAFGVVGELAFDGPFRGQAARINHGTAADIVVGRWFTLAADGTARPGGAAPAGGHAGVLMNPKNYPSLGTAGNALSPTMTLPTGTIGEFGYMGAIVVSVATAVAIGQAAKYADATGIISAGAPGAGETAIPNSKFIRYANAAAGLAVLEVTI